MELLWRIEGGHLLCRRAPQTPPFGDDVGASLFDQTHDFDRVEPVTGEVVERFRRRHARVDQKDAWYLTGHVVEGDSLLELLFRVQIPEHHGGRQREALGRTVLLTGLAPQPCRRWATPEGHHLLEGAPQTTTYGSAPPCELLEDLHDYTLTDPTSGAVLERFHRSDVLVGHGDTEVLTRHRVEEDALVEHVFDYYEDSCWGTSHLRGQERRIRLSGLVALADDRGRR